MQPAGGGDPSAKEANPTPNRVELSQQQAQVSQAAPQSSQSPADQHIEPTSSGCANQSIEGGASILGAAHSAIDVLVPARSRLLELAIRNRCDVEAFEICPRWRVDNLPRLKRPTLRIGHTNDRHERRIPHDKASPRLNSPVDRAIVALVWLDGGYVEFRALGVLRLRADNGCRRETDQYDSHVVTQLRHG